MSEIYEVAQKYADRCDKSKIVCTSVWRNGMKVDREGSEKPVKNGNGFEN